MLQNTVYSVSQVNARIEGIVSSDPMLSNVTVEGEVSNCKYNQSGHVYFTLKDNLSAISCVMFAGKRMSGLKFPMKDGDKVIVTGYVGVYAVAGRYQLYASLIELSGVGNLYQRFEHLKKELAEEGLFDERHKRPLPPYAMRIGVVTAPTGAAVHDIIRVSKSRNPYVELFLYPAVVQGENAAPSVAAGIAMLDKMGLDVLIVGRGGGSIEDLWAFNEELVVRAIYNARTPIVSAVGHETDVTIADFVADVRAATPSQAAEMVNFVYDDFRQKIDRYHDKLERGMDFRLQSAIQRIDSYKSRLLAMRPDNRLQAKSEKLTAMAHRLDLLIQRRLEQCENRLKLLAGKLEAHSPARRLGGGFGYVTDTQGRRIDSVAMLSVGDTIRVRIADGTVESRVDRIEN